MKQRIHSFDRRVTQMVVAIFGHRSRRFFEVMSLLGDPATIALISVGVIAAGMYQSNTQLALCGVVIPVTVLVGALLKILFERARPVTQYAMNMKIQTFSFPSGHSSGSTIAYGLLAFIAFVKLDTPWSLIAGSLLAVLPVFVGISRVYLGAHFPSDVLAGWLLGIIALVSALLVLGALI